MIGLSFPRKWESLIFSNIWISVFTEMTDNKYLSHKLFNWRERRSTKQKRL